MGGAASHHEHELVLDVLQMVEPAFAVNRSHQIVAWNDGAERLLGLRADEVLGMRCYEALSTSEGAVCGDCNACCAPAVVDSLRSRSEARPRRAAGAAVSGGPAAIMATATVRRSLSVTTLAARTHGGQLRVVHLLREATTTVPQRHQAPETLNVLASASAPGASGVNSATTPVKGGAETARPSGPLGNPAESNGKQRRPAALTQRELEVLRLLGAGHSTDDIARELSITRVTARNHVNKVLDKLGVNSRLQAVVIASQLHLI